MPCILLADQVEANDEVFVRPEFAQLAGGGEFFPDLPVGAASVARIDQFEVEVLVIPANFVSYFPEDFRHFFVVVTATVEIVHGAEASTQLDVKNMVDEQRTKGSFVVLGEHWFIGP